MEMEEKVQGGTQVGEGVSLMPQGPRPHPRPTWISAKLWGPQLSACSHPS